MIAHWQQRPHPFRWLLDLGTAGYGRTTRRRLNVLNATATLIAVSSAAYAVSYALRDAHGFRWVIAINLALLVMALSVPLAHRIHELAGGLLIMLTEIPALFGLVSLLGRDSGIQLNLVIGAAAAFFVFGSARPLLGIVTVILCFSAHVAAWFWFPIGMVPVDRGFLDQLYIGAAVNVFVLTAALTWYSFRSVERAEAATEALLANILPDPVIGRLREHPEQSIADAFEHASILFSDIQGFVPLSKSLGAGRTVALLNEMMRRFDALADRYGVEKIKTIGDAYMAVAGLPEPVDDHADRLARMGLEMFAAKNEVAAHFGVTIRMRIGIASGPVMAGIIGTHKFSYDVWGDAVNLAARLESSGEAERIQVSADARRAMSPDRFDFESRGEVEIKGLGPLETWFLVPKETRDEAA
ncbi:MAG TPA: adenylate/guanylate cyclase domain-containing protein [Stellaceae bacterium]|nr:adenylate/guanylate cyclase domain-containing protein [Stellaceae bacterium]